ncbi:MAG: YbaK/EbsC family protein [Deltaproteobacteria bacterium]
MNDTQEISRFLESRIHHAYTIETGSDGVHAEDADDSLGVTSECLAKSVPLVVDGRICMAIIPATRQVNLEKLRHYMKAGEVRPASEGDYKPLLPPGEYGFMPIFGRTFGIQILVAHELMDYQEIGFIVGASQVIVHIRLCDYLAAENPNVCARNAILSDGQRKPIESVVVYRLDEDTMEREPVGTLVERRKADRGERLLGLLRLARKSFAATGRNHAIIVIGD